MHMIDGTTCLMEVEQLIREYTQMLGRDLSFQKLEEELRDLDVNTEVFQIKKYVV